MVDTLRTSGWRFSPGGGGEPGGASVRARTPTRRTVGVAIDPGARRALHPRQRQPGGTPAGFATRAGRGAPCRFRLDGAESHPDSAFRFEPQSFRGPSAGVGASGSARADGEPPGLRLEDRATAAAIQLRTAGAMRAPANGRGSEQTVALAAEDREFAPCRIPIRIALASGAAEISCARPGAVPPASAAPVPGKDEDS